MIKELLGFVVLTGPLFFIVLWLPISLVLAVWISRKYIKKKPAIKIAGVVVIFLVVFLLPVADEIAGRIYFNHLCETEAGAKIYQTIELPAKYWDKDGKPVFMASSGDVNWEGLNNIAVDSIIEKKLSSLFAITDYRHVVKSNSGKLYGEVVNFMFWGGWLIRSTTASNSAMVCKRKNKKSFWYDYYSSLFQPSVEVKGEMNDGNN